MSGHTPGPWHVGPVDDTLIKSADGSDIASLTADYEDFEQWPVMEANALLIAAAPDMLEALQNIENDAGQMPSNAWQLIQSAIAKAIGADA